MPLPNTEPFPNLAAAARAAMQYLQTELGLGQWMFTRVEGDDWIVLDAVGNQYPVAAGTVLAWSDSFCSRLIAGEGPMLAPRAHDVPAYAAAPIATAFHIESYVGIPIYRNDGSLFGTMCGIDAAPSPAIEKYQPLVELFARMLGFAVDRQSEADDAARRAEASQTEAHIDALTGILNRRGWDKLVALEEERCRQTGYPVSVFVVDLDGFKEINDSLGHLVGDTVLQSVAAVLRSTFRSADVVARTGGDEFSILAVQCDGAQCEQLAQRLTAKLAAASLEASVGFGSRSATHIAEMWHIADRAMYAAKRERKPVRLASAV